MSRRTDEARTVSPAARVFSNLQADDVLLPSETSVSRKTGAIFLALLLLSAVPLFWAANAAGLIGDVPAAVAKSSNSGPGGGDDDDDNSGRGDADDDDRTFLKTDDTSGAVSTRGTTADNDTNTRTQRGTDDTSRNGNSTRGTTRDNDTNTNTDNSATGTQTRTRGQTQTRTRTGG